MRLTAIVRGVNACFARIVFERDSGRADRGWSSNSDWRLSVVLALARGRRLGVAALLKGLMMGSRHQLLHAAADGVRRRKLRDQDRPQRDVRRTSARMRAINVGVQFGYEISGRACAAGRCHRTCVVRRRADRERPEGTAEQVSDKSGGGPRRRYTRATPTESRRRTGGRERRDGGGDGRQPRCSRISLPERGRDPPSLRARPRHPVVGHCVIETTRRFETATS